MEKAALQRWARFATFVGVALLTALVRGEWLLVLALVLLAVPVVRAAPARLRPRNGSWSMPRVRPEWRRGFVTWLLGAFVAGALAAALGLPALVVTLLVALTAAWVLVAAPDRGSGTVPLPRRARASATSSWTER